MSPRTNPVDFTTAELATVALNAIIARIEEQLEDSSLQGFKTIISTNALEDCWVIAMIAQKEIRDHASKNKEKVRI